MMPIGNDWLRRYLVAEDDDAEFQIGLDSDLDNLMRSTKMHYRNGREAKNGDKIVQLGSEGKIQSFGILHSATTGQDYCNGSIAVIQNMPGACMCDCLHIDDVAEMLAEKGLDKRPEGK